jgi:XTP/dITP diphosphohydrolase
MNNIEQKKQSFERILNIMDELRADCPWDSVQTKESLRTLTIEEVYELSEAIQQNNWDAIKKELGDVLLHLIFYSKIASEEKKFDIADVINSLAEKLIYRHPHIYGNTPVQNKEEVSQNWEELKLKEKDGNKSVLSGIPKAVPSIIKAFRLQDKARGVGFDWDEKEQVWEKVKEELNEFQYEMQNHHQEHAEEEFGDLLFSLINAARLYEINPDDALEKTNQKFIRRFNYLESKTIKIGKELKNMTLAEMDEIWDEAKKIEQNEKGI